MIILTEEGVSCFIPEGPLYLYLSAPYLFALLVVEAWVSFVRVFIYFRYMVCLKAHLCQSSLSRAFEISET